MGLIRIELFDGAAAGLALPTISQTEIKKQPVFRLAFTRAAQERFFGGALDPEKDGLSLRLTDDREARHILGVSRAKLGDPDGLPLGGGARGSVSLKLRPWVAVSGGKRPAVRLDFVHETGRLIKFKLPEWARPAPAKVHQGKGIMDD